LELIAGLLAILAIAWLVFVAIIWLHRPTRDFAIPALRTVPDVVRLVRSLVADRETPTIAKAALAGLLAYLISPIDLIPDLIPASASWTTW